VWQPYAVETEPGIQAIVTMICPDGSQYAVPQEKRCVLLVPHLSAWDDLHDKPTQTLLGDGGRVLGVDPRGIGQSVPQGCDGADFLAPYDADYFYDAHGILLGEPYLGRRVYDVLRTLDWLYGCGYREIQLAGRGMGAVTALYAGVMEPRLKGVTLLNGLLSYRELTEIPIHPWPPSAQVRGALRSFDLPDCYRALQRKLTLIDPWDAQMRRMPAAKARQRAKAMGLPPRVLRRR
jgi:pimeloyl-ACP methyl ester carboxylesterase